jgi:hypothetical protein
LKEIRKKHTSSPLRVEVIPQMAIVNVRDGCCDEEGEGKKEGRKEQSLDEKRRVVG